MSGVEHPLREFGGGGGLIWDIPGFQHSVRFSDEGHDRLFPASDWLPTTLGNRSFVAENKAVSKA